MTVDNPKTPGRPAHASRGDRQHSVVRRLIVTLTLALGLVALLIAAALPTVVSRQGRAELEAAADQSIAFLARTLAQPLWDFDEQSTRIIGKTFATDERITRLMIYGSKGEALFAFARAAEDDAIQRSSPVIMHGRTLGAVELAYSQRFYRAGVRQVLAATSVSGIFAVLTVFVLAGVIVRAYLRRPLAQLTATVHAYGTGDYSLDVRDIRYSEFRPFGKVLHAMGERITTQLRELRESRELLAHSQSIAHVGGWQHDVAEDNLLWTDEMYRICGLASGSFSPTRATFLQMIHPEDRPRVEAEYSRSMQGGTDHFSTEYRIIRREDENIRHVREKWTHLRDTAGKVVRSTGVIQDITEQKRAELRERELAERIAEADRIDSLGVLSGSVAHDLNNILGPIMVLPEAISDILRKFPNANEPEMLEAQKDLEMIVAAARRAAATVSHLKVLGRGGHLTLAPLDINRFMRDCLASNDIQSLHREHPQVNFDVRIPESSRLVNGNEASLHRVMLNLVINAVEAIPADGTVRIDSTTASLRDPLVGYQIIAPGDYAVIRVRDTGSGIPVSVMRRIFDPFVTTKRDSGGQSGSGLGLSVVHAVMQEHHGFIDVLSNEEGWATTFALYLPIDSTAETQAEGVRRAVAGDVPSGKGEILVVDDELAQRFIAKRVLSRLGYTVAEAFGGRDAVRICRERKADGAAMFDLALIDMTMESNFDGLDTLKALRDINPKQRAIIVSGHAHEERCAAATALGAGWLSKPYSRMDLARAVHEMLAGG